MLYKQLKKIRQQVMEWITLKLYFPIVFRVYKPANTPFSRGYLDNLPKGTLGKSLLAFLDTNRLCLIPTYELHDVKHLLLGYGVGFTDEIQLQYFELGNGNRSLPVLIVVVAGTLLAPDCLLLYLKAYNRGKRTLPMHAQLLANNMETDVNLLKQQLHILEETI